MTEWHDIASAPRDGTRVLLWTRTDLHPDDIDYISGMCEGEHLMTAQIGTMFPGDKEWDVPLIGRPTHWMPLPTPPSFTSAPSKPMREA